MVKFMAYCLPSYNVRIKFNDFSVKPPTIIIMVLEFKNDAIKGQIQLFFRLGANKVKALWPPSPHMSPQNINCITKRVATTKTVGQCCTYDLNHRGRMVRLCINKLGHHWFRWCLVVYWAPSFYLNQCRILYWTLASVNNELIYNNMYKNALKISFAVCCPSCLGFNVLKCYWDHAALSSIPVIDPNSKTMEGFR